MGNPSGKLRTLINGNGKLSIFYLDFGEEFNLNNYYG